MIRLLTASFAAVLSVAGPAVATDVKDTCVNSTNWTEKACQCLAEKASSLSAEQQDYIIAFLNEDADGRAKAEAALSVTQFADVNTSIVNWTTECQGD